MTPFVPTAEQRKQVELMAGMGLTHEEIATLTLNPRTERGIDRLTLERHFRAELDRGGPKLKGQVVQSIYRKALGDGPQSVTAAIFIAKCRYGWREKSVIEVEGASGVLVVPAGVAVDEWVKQQRAAEEAKVDAPSE